MLSRASTHFEDSTDRKTYRETVVSRFYASRKSVPLTTDYRTPTFSLPTRRKPEISLPIFGISVDVPLI